MTDPHDPRVGRGPLAARRAAPRRAPSARLHRRLHHDKDLKSMAAEVAALHRLKELLEGIAT